MIGLHFYTDHKDTPLLGSLIKYFDKPSFKPWQKTVISAVLEGKDTLIVQSTGAGKSLCFQFPCVATKVTIVIMPTVSLIIDQHHSLQEHGFHVTYLGSLQTDSSIHSKMPRLTMKLYLVHQKVLTMNLVNQNQFLRHFVCKKRLD